MNNNLISFNPCQDVFLYFDDSSLKNCVDIDIKEGVDTVVFDGGNSQISINLQLTVRLLSLKVHHTIIDL